MAAVHSGVVSGVQGSGARCLSTNCRAATLSKYMPSIITFVLAVSCLLYLVGSTVLFWQRLRSNSLPVSEYRRLLLRLLVLAASLCGPVLSLDPSVALTPRGALTHAFAVLTGLLIAAFFLGQVLRHLRAQFQAPASLLHVAQSQTVPLFLAWVDVREPVVMHDTAICHFTLVETEVDLTTLHVQASPSSDAGDTSQLLRLADLSRDERERILRTTAITLPLVRLGERAIVLSGRLLEDPTLTVRILSPDFNPTQMDQRADVETLCSHGLRFPITAQSAGHKTIQFVLLDGSGLVRGQVTVGIRVLPHKSRIISAMPKAALVITTVLGIATSAILAWEKIRTLIHK